MKEGTTAPFEGSSEQDNAQPNRWCWQQFLLFLNWFCTGLTSGPTQLWRFVFLQRVESFLNQYNVDRPTTGIVLNVKEMEDDACSWCGITYKYCYETLWYERSCHYIKIPRQTGKDGLEYPFPGQPIELVLLLAAAATRPSSAFPKASLDSMRDDSDIFEFVIDSSQTLLNTAIELFFMFSLWFPILAVVYGIAMGEPLQIVSAVMEIALVVLLGLVRCWFRHEQLFLQMKEGGKVMAHPHVIQECIEEAYWASSASSARLRRATS